MISSVLKRDIDAYADQLRAESLLMARAKAGTLRPSAVGKYLSSIHYLLTQTPVNLERARARAIAGDAPLLARFFEQKIAEEAGHHEWAESDLDHLERAFGADMGDGTPATTMRELVRSTQEAIDADPYAYLAYILFAEYFTVVLGPEWIAALQGRCGVPAEAMTAVSRHVELDEDHVAGGSHEIDALAADAAHHGSLHAMLVSTMKNFSRFCEEVCEA